MDIMVLGSGAGEGYPDPFCSCKNCSYARAHGGRNLRDNSAILIDGRLMVDMTESALRNAVRYGVSLEPVRTLLVTHPHTDHFTPNQLWKRLYPEEFDAYDEAGLAAKKGAPCVRPLPQMDIYGTAFVGEAISQAADLSGPHSLYRFAFHQIKDGDSFTADGYVVTALSARHGPEGYGVNYIIERDGVRLLYASDTGGYDEETWALVLGKRYDGVMVEATCGEMPLPEMAGHMNLNKAEAFIQRLRGHGCLAKGAAVYFTHLSPHWTPPHDLLVPAMGKKGIGVAYDGQTIRIG